MNLQFFAEEPEVQEDVKEPVDEPAVEPENELIEQTIEEPADQEQLSVPNANYAELQAKFDELAAQLQWIEKAEQAVPKESQAEATPVISSIGQPTPVKTEVEADLKDLTASQKLQNYFQEFFGK